MNAAKPPNPTELILFKFIKKCRKNYVFAADKLLNTELTTAQKAMIFAMQISSFVLIVASRGFGKSFILGVFAAIRAMLHPKERIVITSASYRQAKVVFSYIQTLWLENEIFQQACSREPIMSSDSCRLYLKNLAEITALPLGDGEKIRGARGHTILIDEAKNVPGDILENVIIPMASTSKNPMIGIKKAKQRRLAEARGEEWTDDNHQANKVIMTTSAWFQMAYLYKVFVDWTKLMKAGNTKYKVLSFTYLDADEGFFDADVVEMARRTMSAVRFAMEWLAYWPADTDGFFPMSLFENARGNFNIELHGQPNKQYGITIDPARENDNFIIMVAELGAVAKLVYVEAASPVADNPNETNGWKILHEKVRNVIKAFNSHGGKVVRISMDAGGGGTTIRDMLSDEYYEVDDDGNKVKVPRILQLKGQNPIHDDLHRLHNSRQILDFVDWGSEWINRNAWNLRALLEKRELLLPNFVMATDKYKKDQSVEVEEKESERQIARMKKRSMMVDIRDVLMDEVEETITECTNIIHEPLPTKPNMYRFKTIKSRMKKDRWATLMLLVDLIYKIREEKLLPESKLVQGVVTGEVIGLAAPPPNPNNHQRLFEDREASLLQAIYDANALKDDGSFFGDLRFDPEGASFGIDQEAM